MSKYYAYIDSESSHEETRLSRDYQSSDNLLKYILNNFKGQTIVYFFAYHNWHSGLNKYDPKLLQDVFLYEIKDYKIVSCKDLEPSSNVLMWLNEDRIVK